MSEGTTIEVAVQKNLVCNQFLSCSGMVRERWCNTRAKGSVNGLVLLTKIIR